MKKDNKMLTFLTVAGLCLSVNISLMINPILQKLIELYPDVSVTTVRSLSTITTVLDLCLSVPISLVLGRRLKYKPVMILSALFTLLGVCPAFVENPPFWFLMVCQIMVGIGFGLGSLRNACVNKMFAGDPGKTATWLGIMMGMCNVVSIVVQPVAGMLADIQVRYAYFVHLLALVPLAINIFVFSEPEEPERATDEPSGQKAQSRSVPGRVYFYAVVSVLITAFSFPVFTGMATLVTSRGIGAAAVAGTITSMYSIGCASSSFLFGLHSRLSERYGLAIDNLILALGFGLITLAQNQLTAMAGAFLCGVGFIFSSLFLIKWAGEASNANARAFSSTLLTTSMSIGAFFSTYWINLSNKLGSVFTFLETDAERTYMLAVILFVLIALIMAVIDPRPKKDTAV